MQVNGCYVRNYENIALFLKANASRDDKLCMVNWPGLKQDNNTLKGCQF